MHEERVTEHAEPHPVPTDRLGQPITRPSESIAWPEHAVPTYTWSVPIDAEGDCRGALQFARWLATESIGQQFRGIHVPPEDGADALASEQKARAVVTSAHADDIFDGFVRTEAEARPSEVLTDLPAELTGGLIVSRRADSDGPQLIRLGGLARRMAEQTSAPVAIVPHDLELGQMSHGPVLLAVDPGSTPAAAAELAVHLAASKRLRVLLVTVANASQLTALTSSMDQVYEAYDEAVRQAADDLVEWAMRHGLATAWREVTRGNVRFAIQALAQRYDASVIICGTRQRSIWQRILEPSRALQLARYARRPVVLVPDREAGVRAVTEPMRTPLAGVGG